MGHSLTPAFSDSRAWRQVAANLDAQRSFAKVISAAAIAIGQDLESVMTDHPGLAEATRLLVHLPQAAASDAFEANLRSVGIAGVETPSMVDLLQAVGQAIDRSHEQDGRTDFANLVRNALVETLAETAATVASHPLHANAHETRAALAEFADSARFPTLAQAFFSRLTRDSLANQLDRILSAKIGSAQAFASVPARDAFDALLTARCRQASGMIEEFARTWHARIGTGPQLDAAASQAFAGLSMKKIIDELEFAGADDG